MPTKRNLAVKPHLNAAVVLVLMTSDAPSAFDALSCSTLSLTDAGFEESWREPGHGFQSCHDTIDWWSDGEDSRYETN